MIFVSILLFMCCFSYDNIVSSPYIWVYPLSCLLMPIMIILYWHIYVYFYYFISNLHKFLENRYRIPKSVRYRLILFKICQKLLSPLILYILQYRYILLPKIIYICTSYTNIFPWQTSFKILLMCSNCMLMQFDNLKWIRYTLYISYEMNWLDWQLTPEIFPPTI